MKKIIISYAFSFFMIGTIAIMVILLWAFFLVIYIFQEPQPYESMGLLLEASRYKLFWAIVLPLSLYTLSFYGLSKSGDKVKNPKWLIKALQLRGWKIVFAVLAILPLSVIKLARVIWQSRPLKNTRSFSREVMESFS